MSLLLDVSHTSHYPGHSGIQRVVRAIYPELQRIIAVTPLCYDHHVRVWRHLRPIEQNLLEWKDPDALAPAKRSFLHKRTARLLNQIGLPCGYPTLKTATRNAAKGFFAPEWFGPDQFLGYQKLFPSLKAPKMALIHDLIAIHLPEFLPQKTVERYPAYLEHLQSFDGIVANSRATKEDLENYWQARGVKEHPPIFAAPLGVDFSHIEPAPTAMPNETPAILCVGTFEGRKNQIALLEAAEKLWADGQQFTLQFIGGLNEETGRRSADKFDQLKQAGHPISWQRGASDDALIDAYRRCDFTVYPSLMEGFGLPVLESLAFGKPCVVAATGALGEVARDGGCAMVNEPTAEQLASVIARLLNDPNERASLARAAQARTFRTWADFARDTLAAFAELRR